MTLQKERTLKQKLLGLFSVIGVVGLVMTGVIVSSAPAAFATVGPGSQVCEPLDSGKIDTTGDPSTVTVTAPEGKLISGYCVKAGSVNQDLGPEYVTLDTPVAEITFGHSSGKAVSHYSVSYVSAPVEPVQVSANPVIQSNQICGAVTLTFSNDLVLGENEYSNAVDFMYTDASGNTQSVVMEANDAPVSVTVSFPEDSGTHEVRAWYSIGESDPLVFLVETDCIVEPPKVTVVTTQPEAPLPYDYCGTDRDVFVPPANTAEYSYVKTVVDSTVYFTLLFNEGFEADGKIQTTWQYTFTNEACPQEETLIEDEVLPPTFPDFCGVEHDELNVPANTDTFTYVVDDRIVDGERVVDVKAVPREPWLYFGEDVMTAWSHVYNDTDCVVVPPVEPPVVVPPVVTPPVVVPPVVVPPVVTPPVVTPPATVVPTVSGEVPGGGTDGADLASMKEQATGINGALPFGVFGLVALLLGLGFLIKRRIATN